MDTPHCNHELTAANDPAMRSFVASLTRCRQIDGIGIGGSRGSGSGDKFSDLDLFVLIRGPIDALYRTANSLREYLPVDFSVAAESPLSLKPGFGFRRSYLFTNYIPTSIFLNTSDTLDPNFMRARTQVVYDPAGVYADLLHARTQHNVERNTACAVDNLALALIPALKYAARADWVPFFVRASRAFVELCGLLAALDLNAPYAIEQGDRTFRALPAESQALALSALPKEYTAVEAHRVLRAYLDVARRTADTQAGDMLISSLTASILTISNVAS